MRQMSAMVKKVEVLGQALQAEIMHIKRSGSPARPAGSSGDAQPGAGNGRRGGPRKDVLPTHIKSHADWWGESGDENSDGASEASGDGLA
eukprot:7195376-Karenia_brevis.AAC.1